MFNEIDFFNNNNILWFPVHLNKAKIPIYDDEIQDKSKHLGYKAKTNDFKNLSIDEIKQRHIHINKTNTIAIDTTSIYHIDIDMKDGVIYNKDNYEFIEELKETFPYYTGNSIHKGKKESKHFFVKVDDFIAIKDRYAKSIYEDIEVLSGQWAFYKKSKQIIKKKNWSFNMCKTKFEKFIEPSIPLNKTIEMKNNEMKVNMNIVKNYNTTTGVNNSKMDIDIIKLCRMIDIKYLNDYDDWRRIMWALKFIGEQYRDIATEISKKSIKYSNEGFINVWDKCNFEYQCITTSTIYYYAKVSNKEEFIKIISNDAYLLKNNDDDLSKVFISYCLEDLVYKDCLYIYHNYKWWIQENDDIMLCSKITSTLKDVINSAYKIVNDKLNKCSDEDLMDEYRKQKATLGKILGKIKSASGVSSIAKCVKRNMIVKDFECIEFDNNPNIIAFKTKYYDFNSHTFKEIKNTDYITIKIGYEFIEPISEDIEIFGNLMKEIFPDKDLLDDYLKIMSCSLYSHNIEKFFIFTGTGGNGKGMLNELMYEMLKSDYCFYAPSQVLMSPLKEGANPSVAGMNNKRLTIFKEPEQDEKLNISTIKELTGGGILNARMLYSNNAKCKLTGIKLLEVNRIPKLSGTMDDSVKRRIINIEFLRIYTDDVEKLKNNPMAIKANVYYKSNEFKKRFKYVFFRYLINFIKQFEDKYDKKIYEDLKFSKRSQCFTTQYINSSDYINEYLDENIEKDPLPASKLKLKDLYDRFKCSDEYRNSNSILYKPFCNDIKLHDDYGKYYQEKVNVVNSNGSKTTVRRVLVGYKLKEELY